MKQFYSVLTAVTILFASTKSFSQVSQGFETQTEVNSLISSCWAFSNVSYTGTNNISGTGSVISQLGVVSEFSTPLLQIPADLTISFSYNTISTNVGGSKTIKVLLDDNGVETVLATLNNPVAGVFSATYNNGNTPGNNISGNKKVIIRITNNLSTAIDDFGVNTTYTFAGGCDPANAPLPLPVKLINFRGILNKSSLQLQWLIADNETAQKFEIQRSINGSSFTTVATVTATQKSGDETYNFSEPVSATKVLYRLKMYDNNSKAEYSKTLAFSNTAQKSLQVLTNPVKEKLVISFSNEIVETAQLNIYDNLGRAVQKQSLNVSQGINTTTVGLNGNYKPGLYIVELVTKAGKLSEKLIYSNQ